jgi:hypothetical protein
LVDVSAGTDAFTEALLVSSSVGAATASGGITSGGVEVTSSSPGFSTPLPPGGRDMFLVSFLPGGGGLPLIVRSYSRVISKFMSFYTLGHESCLIYKHSKKVAVKKAMFWLLSGKQILDEWQKLF